MSIYIIDCNKTDYDTFKLTLESVAYDLTIRYNAYDESFTGYIGLSGSDPVCSFKMTTGRDLLKPYRYMSSVPKGKLQILDTMYSTGRVDQTDFGSDKRFKLFYTDSTDTTTLADLEA